MGPICLFTSPGGDSDIKFENHCRRKRQKGSEHFLHVQQQGWMDEHQIWHPVRLHFPASFADEHGHGIQFLTMESEQKACCCTPWILAMPDPLSCPNCQTDANIQGNLANQAWKMAEALSAWVPEGVHGAIFLPPQSRYAAITLLPTYSIKLILLTNWNRVLCLFVGGISHKTIPISVPFT